jgi:hypothetical protein
MMRTGFEQSENDIKNACDEASKALVSIMQGTTQTGLAELYSKE